MGVNTEEDILKLTDKDEIEKRIKTKYNHKIRKYRNIAFLSVLNFILFLSITSLYGNKIDTRLLYSIFFLLSFCFFILLDLECTDCLNCKKNDEYCKHLKTGEEEVRKTKNMKKLKKLWIKIISIVGELLANILLFHTPVKFKRFVFMNFYKIVIASILIILGIIMYFILKFLV